MNHVLPRWAAGAALLLLVACTTVQTDSLALIDQGQYREGLARLEQAMKQRPGDQELRITYFRARDRAVNLLLVQAMSEAGAGRAEPAAAFYRQALQIDPSHARANAGLSALESARRHQQLAENAKARLASGDAAGADLMVKAILSESPGHPQARELDRELREAERQKAVTVPALKSKLQTPVNLEFRDAPLRLVMEALQKSAGINFMLDRDIRPDTKTTIFVKNVRVEDAIDLILQNNQLEKKVLTENTILIYPATQQKLREHQELVMRTFQIGNADPKQTVNMLRTMLKTKDIFVDERVNMIVMRDTPDVIRAAERLIAAQDMADGEVVLELEILEVSRSRVRELGITYPNEFGGGLIGFGNRITNALELSPGVKLKLLATDGETKTLANPRVRVRNRDKARIHIGDRVPVISSTIVGTTTSAGQAGSAPVTTEQIQYIDVGIKIEAEPTLYPDDTVAVKINLDVSSLGTKTTTNAGSVAYEVGTRNATTVLRLKDGETQALMGLIRDEDVLSRSGIPLVGELPLLDMIFGSRTTEKRSRELVLLITPQLVRGIRPPDATLAEFWSGTEGAVRLRAPVVQQLPEPGKKPAGAAGPDAAAAPATLSTEAPAALAAVQPLALSWSAPPKVKAGQEFMIELRGRSAGALKSAAVQLRYDPAELEILGADKAGYFKPASGTTVYTPNVDAAMGIVGASIAVAEADAAPGDGGLLQLRAKAKGKGGQTLLQITHVIAIDPANRRVPLQGSLPLSLVVEP
ncbi:Type II and III secretion system protein [Rubrivivax sp. A210]|uniref:secretin N-terminal domain-containing protein n=1 Tax=Rubrivivax sp. A210 TaxID=2772301 RepID=UPI001917F466|nr:secretin N-terminal domain-containing protein [Rubrivivax sp. A210]CAD5369836.1 Type II and III secretion system protein [Rubrivivax sp. A210]